MKQLFSFITGLVLLSISACQKGEEQPAYPSITQSGENVVACKINGKSYVFKGKPAGFNPGGVGFYNGLAGDVNNNVVSEIGFYGRSVVEGFYKVGVIIHSDSSYVYKVDTPYFITDRNRQEFYIASDISNKEKYYYALPNSGWVQFSRLDSIGSGTFAFTAYSSTDSVVVTEGRFDITQ